jgi:structural maintenance of chromosome 3 (chondroitin sulfate proteoglycan 6)
MHIKNIIISGFRSYRDQAFQEELSPKHNVVVGRNGSGKSNFFAAIQFVLSEKFANLRADERKDLFHAGAGRPALAVFVEIVFDNSDGRIVIPGRPDETEVRIRRTIGLKQDEFRVNDRRFTASEIRQLLESAGFSSSNPYYIVEQGKIVSLANMNEVDRYQLIKDVAGTKVYESRRSESEQILEESQGKLLKIDEAVKQLDDRLNVLEAETTELRSFQETDRKRKAIEFCVYNSELSTAKEELERLDKEWNSKPLDNQNETLAIEVSLKAEEQKITSLDKRAQQVEVERKRLEKERSELVSRRALLALKADDATNSATGQEKEKSELRIQEKEMRKGFHDTKRDLDQKQKLVSDTTKKANESQSALYSLEGQLEVLQAKRGRKNQFKSKAERDAWIRGEIIHNKEVMDSNAKEISRLESEERRINTELQERKEETKYNSKSVAEAEVSLNNNEGSRSKLLAERDKLTSERRKLWAAVQEKEQSVRRLTDAVENCSKQFEKSCRLDIRQGVASVLECLDEIGDKRLKSAVHGQIIDLIGVEDGFERAVDVTGGNALFNVVVDSFDVSTKLLDHMNKRKKPGRVTFFPLDTCKSVAKDIPTTSTYSGLLSHIKYDKKFSSAMAELFGKTAVAQSLEAASLVVKELDVDAVTRDGDQFSRKGGITGGFIEKRTTRLSAHNQLADAKRKLHGEREQLAALCQNVAQVEQSVTDLLQRIEVSSSQDSVTRANVEGARFDARSIEDRCHRLSQLQQQNARARDVMQKTNENLRRTNAALGEELTTDFKGLLSAEEERKLEQLQQVVSTSRGEAASVQSRLVQLSTEQELLRGQLHYFESNLALIEDRLASLGSAKSDPLLLREVATLDEEIRIVDDRISLMEQGGERDAVERKKLEDKLVTLRAQLVAASKVQQEEKDIIERSHNQRTLLIRRKDDASSKIRKLGIIPQEIDRYAAYSIGKLMHLLRGVQEEMKKFAHVNKKAVDQYSALVETRNELTQQKQGLQQELKSILDLMQHLDERKDEAIQRTYKQVQFNFEKVFEELVQAEGASAELQLVRNTDRTAADPYSAIRVKVTFGVGTAVSELNQLSGGQKSLVALALIFAIQRCDPAPFYLFDEIDAALDAEYRTAVANVIRKQSESCQFITATFKMEMLEAADSILGIFFHNKVSRIQPISRDEGQRLLKQAAMDERKRNREEEEQN